jgi:hypothetical protein
LLENFIEKRNFISHILASDKEHQGSFFIVSNVSVEMTLSVEFNIRLLLSSLCCLLLFITFLLLFLLFKWCLNLFSSCKL